MAGPRNLSSAQNEEIMKTTTCPKCKSQPGAKCTTYSGRTMGFVHTDRETAYNVKVESDKATEEQSRSFGEAAKMADTIVSQTLGTQDAVAKTVATPRINTKLVEKMLGQKLEDAEARLKRIQEIEGGLRLLMGMQGIDWTIRRLAEMVTDNAFEEFTF